MEKNLCKLSMSQRLASIIGDSLSFKSDLYRRDFLDDLLLVQSASEAPLAAQLFKKVARPDDVMYMRSRTSTAFRAYPEVFRAWASFVSRKFPTAEAADEIYLKNMHPQQQTMYNKIVLDTLPSNSTERKNYMQYRAMVQYINRSKPCRPLKAIIIDRTAEPQTKQFVLDGVTISVSIQQYAPTNLVLELKRGVISLCDYASDIYSRVRGNDNDNNNGYGGNPVHFFMMDDRYLLSAATCKQKKHTMHVNYVCSARVCKGAGKLVMRLIERYSESQKARRIKLLSDPRVKKFYTRIGYNTNSNNEQKKVKYLASGKRRRSPSPSRSPTASSQSLKRKRSMSPSSRSS
jgi:Acetyltransferase (GNAT) domain